MAGEVACRHGPKAPGAVVHQKISGAVAFGSGVIYHVKSLSHRREQTRPLLLSTLG